MIRFVLAAAVSAALYPATAYADFGAIAFSQQTGAHGYSYGAESRGQAENIALKNCRAYGGGCFIAIWFRNSCGALAVGSEWGWGSSHAGDRGQAGRRALANCRQNDDGCQVVQRVCSG